MRPSVVLDEHLPRVTSFAAEIAEAKDDKERQANLRRVSSLIRFMSSFYEVFLPEQFDVSVRGFSYKDKRKVSRRLIRAEAEGAPDDGLNAKRDLAARFEELSDLFHGTLDFGYSEEDSDYATFHREVFPDWLDMVEKWLRSTGKDTDRALADKVDAVSRRYADAVSSIN